MRIRIDTSKLQKGLPTDLSEFAVSFQNHSLEFTQRTISTIIEHLPVVDHILETTLHLVPHSEADAYVEYVDGEPHMTIDLSRFLADTDQETWANLYAAAYHEFWHVAFGKYIESNWRVKNPYVVPDPNYGLVFTMLDEGYGHYLSLTAYGGGKEGAHRILLSKSATDTHTGFFERFHPKIEEFNVSSDSRKRQLVHESHIGSMWDKWGALTGALVISTLQMQFGGKEVAGSIGQNPYSIWFLHQESCDLHQRLGEGFLAMVRGLEKREAEGLFDSPGI
jgi:hypothetical protein